MSALPFVSIIIVNYNSGFYAKTCVDAILKQKNIRSEIIIVDNNSADDSVNLLKTTFDCPLQTGQVKIMASPENLGFGRANNLAATHAQGDYLLLLNPDTDIKETNALSALVQYLAENTQFGMVGPAIVEARRKRGGQGDLVLPRLTYPAQKQTSQSRKLAQLPGKIAWLLGACLLFRRQVFQAIGGFDADYFLYGEDADIGLRIRQNGFEIGYCSEVEISHIAGTSEINADSYNKWLRKKRGIYLFFTKHYPTKDVEKICRNAQRKTRLSIVLQKVKLLLKPNQPRALEKISKARAENLVATEVLAQYKH